jgi:tetratricopeptide (TPR) repeat protein
MELRPGRVFVGLVAAIVLLASNARAVQSPVDYQQKATAAFALGHYAEAAESFEKAFELTPEPALLYNAAQAYRLAGNKERALTLYENYLRVYGGKDKRAELESRIDELKRAIEHDKTVATQPPNGTEPVAPVAGQTGTSAGSAAPLPNASPPANGRSAPVLVSQPGEAAEKDRPLTSKAWFWGVVGGAVVAAVVVGLLVASGGAKDPSGSLGKVNAN